MSAPPWREPHTKLLKTKQITHMNNFPIAPKMYRNIAQKAVFGYVRKQYPKYFSHEDMEDMVSEVTLRMWRAKDSFDAEKGDVFQWVWSIAKNVVRTQALAKHNRTDISLSFEDGDIQDNCPYSTYRGDEFGADKDILFDEMQECLFDKLKSDRDKLFLCWKMEGLDSKEMAERAGISVEAVYMVMFHLKQKLKDAA